MPHTETVIVGGGQAGLATSHELTARGRDHVVLERGRVGERWRSERWDSLALLSPNWMNRLPGMPPVGADPDGFISREEFVSRLEEYARSFGAPVRQGVTVLSVSADDGGYVVHTDAETWRAQNVVLASGANALPRMPAVAAGAPDGLARLHSSSYRSPAVLPPGGVLVVGAGASGQQIALELRRAGRPVWIAAGGHTRMPRRYRGRDVFAWLDAIGHLATTIDEMPDPVAARRSPSLPLDGRNGGATIDLGVLADAGVRLAGRVTGFAGRHVLFADDLLESICAAEDRMRRLLGRIDAFADALADPPAPEVIAPLAVDPGPPSLDLHAEGIGSVLWATGYRQAYPWLGVNVFDEAGSIAHRRGVTEAPGLYVIGLRFLHRFDSHFIGGVGRDAAYIASHIGEQSAGEIRELAA